jgi:hypothetical protein
MIFALHKRYMGKVKNGKYFGEKLQLGKEQGT